MLATAMYNVLIFGALVKFVHLKFVAFGIASPWLGWALLIPMLALGAFMLGKIVKGASLKAILPSLLLGGMLYYAAYLFGFSVGNIAFAVGMVVWFMFLPLTWYSFRDIIGSFISAVTYKQQFKEMEGMSSWDRLLLKIKGMPFSFSSRRLSRMLRTILYYNFISSCNFTFWYYYFKRVCRIRVAT